MRHRNGSPNEGGFGHLFSNQGKLKMKNSMLFLITTFSMILLLTSFTPETAWTQEVARSFRELQFKVKTGETVYVTDDAGLEFKGRIAEMSSSSLRLLLQGTHRDLTETDVHEIRQKQSDPLWNGVLIGLVAGAASGLVAPLVACSLPDPECAAIVDVISVPAGAAIGAITGALIDKAVRKSRIIYLKANSASGTRVTLSPVLSKGLRGMQITIRF